MRGHGLARIAALLAALLLIGSARAEEEIMRKPFSLNQIVLGDAYSQNALRREIDYLTSFDVDRLLIGFRETAGLDTRGKARYGGWEKLLIGGHTAGHYLTACAQGYANAAVSPQDREKLYALVTELVDGLAQCQENSRGEPGFLFGAAILDEKRVEIQFDNVEKRKTNIFTEAWVPWYTMHKLLSGLISVYECVGYEPALRVAEGLGEWAYARASAWSEEQRRIVLSTEYGGMNDCLYELYRLTGNERFAVAAHLFDETELFDRVLHGGENALNNLHANTTIPKFLGALNRYACAHGRTIAGETVDASAYLAYAKAFFDMVESHHTYITGGNSEWEHFGLDDVLDAERTNCNNETCNVYNMLKLARQLYELTGETRYMAYYENAYINAILSSQNPETGMTTYFQPMASGYFKVYSTPHHSFWCCTGSGMENFTKLGDSVYFHTDDAVYTELYFSSELRWAEKGLTLRQTSGFPEEGRAVFDVSLEKGAVDLYFRVPDWAEGMRILRQGREAACETVTGHLVARDVRDGEQITVLLPMRVTAHALPDNPAAVAFKYGPMVLSADLGEDSMDTTYTGVDVLIPAAPAGPEAVVVLPDEAAREALMRDPGAFLEKAPDGLSFRLAGTDFVYSPHYLRCGERYAVYMLFQTADEAADQSKKNPRCREILLDTVQPGYGQYESDSLHALRETSTVAITNDGTCRYAKAGGSFAYRMHVSKAGGNVLTFTLRAADNGKTLRVLADDAVLYEKTLRYAGEETAYSVRVRIPDALAASAKTIEANGAPHDVLTFTFSGIDGGESARVCDFVHTLVVKPLYEVDPSLAYFVDCGDHDPCTLSQGDRLGLYNSVTEQVFGPDEATGMCWGLVDDPRDLQKGGSAEDGAIYTANTWAFEYNKSDGLPKTISNRYTKNQYERGMTRAIDYAFELPDGVYPVEIGLCNPWNCSDRPDVYANLGKADEQLLAKAYPVARGPLRASVTVTGGELTLNLRNAADAGKAINVAYIKIAMPE